MKSAILMTSVAVAALAAPAWAEPDRFENGCMAGVNAAPCVQQQLTNDGGAGPVSHSATDGGTGAGLGGFGSTAAAARIGNSSDNDSFGNEVGDAADEAGDTVGHAANEAGDAIGHTADEAGESIGHAADEAGDAIGGAFD